MKTKELIEQLQQFDPEADVCLDMNRGCYIRLQSVRQVFAYEYNQTMNCPAPPDYRIIALT